MLHSVSDLIDQAQLLYRAGADLRDKDQYIDETRYAVHPVPIPEDMADRAQELRPSAAAEKLDRGVDLMGDSDDAIVTVIQLGTSQKSERAREVVQNWAQAFLTAADAQADGRSYIATLKYEALSRSRLCTKVFPDLSRWAGLADVTADVIDDPYGVDDVIARVNAAEENQDRARARDLPIAVQQVDTINVYPRYNSRGDLIEVYEIVRLPVTRILEDFRDAAGEPLAQALQRAADARRTGLTERDMATLVIRADRTDMQIAVMGTDLGSTDVDRGDAINAGQDELLWEGEHPLAAYGRVPYVFTVARHTNARDPRRFFHPFIDEAVCALSRALDNMWTQLASTGRMTAWPGMYIRRGKDAAGATQVSASEGEDDAPASFDFSEGGVFDGLGVDEDFQRLPWADPSAQAVLKDSITLAQQQLDRMTIGSAGYGAGGLSNSGYELAQQQAAATTTLNPFVRAVNRHLAEVLQLVLLCARAINEAGLGPIPVRYVGEDSAAYVTLKEEHTAIDWSLTVSIRTKPLGGEAALFQTLDGQRQAGVISLLTERERLGIRNPEREQTRIDLEKVRQAPEFWQAIMQLLVQRATQQIQQQNTPAIPQNALASPALASVLSSPQALALLPPGMGAQPPAGQEPPQEPAGGMPPAGVGGLPNMASFNGPPPLPTPTARTVAAHLPGPPPGSGLSGGIRGQAQTMPGGLQRASQLNALGPPQPPTSG